MIIEVNSRNQITLPWLVCENLNIKAGDTLLLDVQDGVMLIIPHLESYTNHLQGLHSEIWKDSEVEEYLANERAAW